MLCGADMSCRLIFEYGVRQLQRFSKSACTLHTNKLKNFPNCFHLISIKYDLSICATFPVVAGGGGGGAASAYVGHVRGHLCVAGHAVQSHRDAATGF